MNYFAFDCKKQGYSHIKNNKECQDSSLSFFDDKIALAIVCDGHGGDDYVRSAVGSSFGCEIAKKNICNFVEKVDKEKLKHYSDQLLVQLKSCIINDWREAVYDHCRQNPFTEKEISVLSEKARKKYLLDKRIESAYGTTLIAVVVTHDYWFGLHIGDGKCVTIGQDGSFSQPIPWDEKCFLNSTTSICDSEALGNFRHFYSEELPVAIFVGSDGIDDCFKGDEQMYHFYTVILSSFVMSDAETAKAELLDYLPRLSKQGSGDDVSVAAVFDRNRVPELKPIKDFITTHKQESETAKEEVGNMEHDHKQSCNGSEAGAKQNETSKANRELEEQFEKVRKAKEELKRSKDALIEKTEAEHKELEKKLKESNDEIMKEISRLGDRTEKERKELEDKLEAKEAENARLRAEVEEEKRRKNRSSLILKIGIPCFFVVMGFVLFFAVGSDEGKDGNDRSNNVAKSEPVEDKEEANGQDEPDEEVSPNAVEDKVSGAPKKIVARGKNGNNSGLENCKEAKPNAGKKGEPEPTFEIVGGLDEGVVAAVTSDAGRETPDANTVQKGESSASDSAHAGFEKDDKEALENQVKAAISQALSEAKTALKGVEAALKAIKDAEKKIDWSAAEQARKDAENASNSAQTAARTAQREAMKIRTNTEVQRDLESVQQLAVDALAKLKNVNEVFDKIKIKKHQQIINKQTRDGTLRENMR